MGAGACDLLEAELGLDRLEAELATELPGHMRAFADAYAAGRTPPAAPVIARRAASVAVAMRALPHPVLAGRALDVLRLVAPIVLENDPAVVRARSVPPSWEALRGLSAARDQAARARFGRGALELIHRLHGSAQISSVTSRDLAVDGWAERGAPLDHTAIARAWEALVGRFSVTGTLELVHSDLARPRAFIVEPGSSAVLVVPRTAETPGAKFAVLHEMGHAIANLAARRGWPRMLDEAAASWVARLLELPDALPAGWYEPLAGAARRRRSAIAASLDVLERELPVPSDLLLPERPPWALWHDPGAQAAYLGAEQLADRLWATLGPAPGLAFGRALVDERIRIDLATVI